jgi:hypothetical protein
MFLPLKLIISTYVPGATRTVSLLTLASMPAWMVGWSSGTFIMVAEAGVISINTNKIEIVGLICFSPRMGYLKQCFSRVFFTSRSGSIMRFSEDSNLAGFLYAPTDVNLL